MACVCLCCICLFAFLEFLIGCLKKIQRLQGRVFLSPCLIRLPGDKRNSRKTKNGTTKYFVQLQSWCLFVVCPRCDVFSWVSKSRYLWSVASWCERKGAKELGLPPAKLTCPLQIDGWKMKISFGMVPL